MELGEKLRHARLEAGLSQRQLCGDEITRNMLSQIENGSARPSMKTLRYLAGRLGKSVSYFLEDTAVVSGNQQTVEAARERYDAGDFGAAVQALEAYRQPDPVYDREMQLLRCISLLELAQAAIASGRERYALELLEKTEIPAHYCTWELQRRYLLLLGQIPGQRVADRLPSLDEELLLRAGEAMAAGDDRRAACLLDAAQDRQTPQWLLLRGEAYLAQDNFMAAARCFHGAETAYPMQTARRLEQCYRELEDYRKAYYYACKQKDAKKAD